MKTRLIALVLLSILGLGRQASAQPALDERGYTIRVDGLDNGRPLHLWFQRDTLLCPVIPTGGVAEIPFVTSDEDTFVLFSATATGPDGAVTSWQGEVADEAISGTYTVAPPDAPSHAVAWSGRLTDGPLDGRRFHIVVGVAEPLADDLTFLGGAFEAFSWRSRGFAPGDYTSTAQPDGSIAFVAETRSRSDGTILWSGTITGNTIDGTLTWLTEGGTPDLRSFTGTGSVRENEVCAHWDYVVGEPLACEGSLTCCYPCGIGGCDAVCRPECPDYQ